MAFLKNKLLGFKYQIYTLKCSSFVLQLDTWIILSPVHVLHKFIGLNNCIGINGASQGGKDHQNDQGPWFV